MVERKVAFNLDMSSGVSQLRNQMSSVVQLSKSTMLQIQQAEERHQARIKELKQKQMEIEKAALVSNVEAHRRAIKAIETEEERHALRMKQMSERAVVNQQSKGAGLSSKMGGVGASLVARGVSSALPNFMGSAVSGGVEAGIGASLMGATAAAATGIGLLAGAAILAGTALSGLKDVAQSVLGAVAQIGGVRGLQEMLVESSSTERMAAMISGNIAEKLSTSDVMQMINTMSKNSEFTPKQIGDMFNAYKGKTGEVSSLFNMGSFSTDLMSSTTGMTPEIAGSLMGQLKAQFGLEGPGLKSALINLRQQGLAGTVELGNAESISQALAFSRAAGKGNLQAGLGLEMGMVQLGQKGIGGTKADEAVTSARRLQEDLMKKPMEIQAAIGGGAIGAHDAQGNFVFNNIANTVARIALGELQNKIPSKLIDERAARLPRAIGEFAVQQPEFKAAKTDAERIKVIENEINAFSKAELALDEFDGAVKKVKDTVDYQFKEAVNKVTIELEGAFLPVLKQMVPIIKSFADSIVSHKDEIAEMFEKFVVGLMVVAEALPKLASAVMGVAQWLGSMLPDADEKVKSTEETLAGQKANLASMESNPTYQGPNAKWVLDAQRKSIAETEASLRMWKGIKGIKDMSLADMQDQAKKDYQKLKPQAPIPPPEPASNTPPKGEDHNTKHLIETKTLAQKQLDVLSAIRANTMPPAPPAPTRSPDGH